MAGLYQPARQVEGSSGMTVRRIRIVVDDPDSHRCGVATYSRGLELAPEGPGPDSLFRRAARAISQLPHATTCHEVSAIQAGGHLHGYHGLRRISDRLRTAHIDRSTDRGVL